MIETHIDYKIRWISIKRKMTVSVVFTSGHYEEDENGNQVYIRGDRFFGDTNEFPANTAYDDIVRFYDEKLAVFAADMGLLSIPEQEVHDE